MSNYLLHANHSNNIERKYQSGMHPGNTIRRGGRVHVHLLPPDHNGQYPARWAAYKDWNTIIRLDAQLLTQDGHPLYIIDAGVVLTTETIHTQYIMEVSTTDQPDPHNDPPQEPPN